MLAMSKKKEHLKRRIILGYASILIVVIIAILQVSTLISRIIEEESRDDPVREKSQIITTTLLMLYECETYTQFFHDDNEEFTQFNRTLDKVLEQLNVLLACSVDSTQQLRIGELESLLEQKRENTELLLKTRQEMKQLYAKHIAEGMATNRNLAKEVGVQMQEETQQQTLLMQRDRKNFFKRLAEAFVPIKADTGIYTNSITRLQTDSLINEYNPSDTIAYVLSRIQAEINKEYNSLNLTLEKRITELRNNNGVITGKINQILFEIGEEWTNSFLEQEMLREEIIRNTSKSLAIIAFISLVTVLVFLYLIFRDISRTRYYRRQLEIAKQLAEDLLENREKFMLMISHDIRAPLSSILGYLQLLRQSPRQDKQEESYMENIAVSAEHILSLVNDLLDLHRLESGQMVIRPIPFNALVLLEEIYAEFKPLTHSKGLSFHLLTDSLQEPYAYTGDPVRIRQAVGNLLSNAIKYTTEGAISLTVSSEPIEDAPEKKTLRISVKDEGPGIAESEQEVIFREFSRLPGTEKIEGFGLGLSITFRLVSLLGGSVSLNSQTGKGSEFIIVLTLPVSDDEPAAKEQQTPPPLLMPKQNLHCLAIDDDLLQLKLTEELLKRNHINVIALSNPNEAINLLKSASFDMILTDIQMPLLDGYAILRHIRSSGISGMDKIPVIALSASLAEEKEHYLKAGFAGFLNKPFTVEELIVVLNELFHTHPQQAEAPLNVSALTAFAEHDAEASASILRTFLAETQKSVASLQESLESGDRPQAARISHKLIPLFTMLGAGAIVGLLRILEANEDSLTDAHWQQTLKEVIAHTLAALKQIRVE
jgi:signal transduction histidine kinase/DNA-binding response OmpR family regulator